MTLTHNNYQIISDLLSVGSAAGKQSVPSDMRRQLEHPLREAIVDRERLTDWVEFLDRSTGSRFPWTATLSSEELETIVTQGFNGVSNWELARIAIDPVSLFMLFTEINSSDDLADEWYGAIEEVECQRHAKTLRVEKSVEEDEERQTPDIITNNLLVKGDILLPGGVAQECHQFGSLPDLSQPVREQIVSEIVSRAVDQLRWQIPKKGKITLVHFGQALRDSAIRIAGKLKHTSGEIKVVSSWNYYDPHFGCDAKSLKSDCVILFTDVSHSGSRLHRLCEFVLRFHPGKIVALSVIDQTHDEERERLKLAGISKYVGLWRSSREVLRNFHDYRLLNPKCDHLLYFDPDKGLAVPFISEKKGQPSIMRKGLIRLEPHIKDALKRYHKICGNTYMHAIDVLALLKNLDARKDILDAVRSELGEIAKNRKLCLVYPTSKCKRAGVLAKMIAEDIDCPAIAIGGTKRGFVFLTEKQRKELSEFDVVVIVDSAIRTGGTFREVSRQLDELRRETRLAIEAMYVVNGLLPHEQEQLENQSGIVIRSIISFPLSEPFPSRDKQLRFHVTEWLRNMVSGLDRQLWETEQPKWKQELRHYLQRSLKNRTKHRVINPNRRKMSEKDLEVAFREGQQNIFGVIDSGDAKRIVSHIRHLKYDHLLMNPKIRDSLRELLASPDMPRTVHEECLFALYTSSEHDFSWIMQWAKNNINRLANSKHAQHNNFLWLSLRYAAEQVAKEGDPQKIAECEAFFSELPGVYIQGVKKLNRHASQQKRAVVQKCNTVLEELHV